MKAKHLFLVIFLTVLSPLFAQKVVGYIDGSLADANTNAEKLQWDKLTDIIFGFIQPTNTAGALEDPANFSNSIQKASFAKIKKLAAANNVKFHFSSGGANGTIKQRLYSIASQDNSRKAYAKNVADVLEAHDMDGFDLDWEFPTSTQVDEHVLLLKALREEFDKRGKGWTLAIAVGGETPSTGKQSIYHTDYVSSDAFQYIDYLNLMSYDIGTSLGGKNHSSYQNALDNINDYAAKGCPKSKMILGVPFYSRGSSSRWTWKKYSAIASTEAKAQTAYNSDNVGTDYYNGKKTLQDKTKLIMDQGGIGIMIWEVTYDRLGNDPYSLLGAIHEAMEPYRCDVPKAELGENFSICGKNSVQLKSNVPNPGNYTYTWFRDNQQVASSSNAENYDATQAGVYKVNVSKPDCGTDSKPVKVLGVLPNIDLGNEITLCNPPQTVLDAKAQGGGITYVWKKNSVIIDEATGQTITVRESGTYEVTISAENCGSKSDQVKVNSSLLPVKGIEICKGEKGNLEVLEDNGPYEWFDSQDAITSIAEGKMYEVSPQENATYYVQKKETFLEKVIGPEGSSTFTSSKTLSHFNFQKIEVKSELTLKTVTYKAGGQGSYSLIKLLNANKEDIAVSTAKQYGANEEIVVTFDKVLAPGTYYFTSTQWAGTVLYNTKKQTYSEEGVMTVNPEEDYNTTSTGTYGFIYDITVKAGFKNQCAKTPVTAVVDQNCNNNEVPTIDITSPDNNTTLVVNSPIEFTVDAKDPNNNIEKVVYTITHKILDIAPIVKEVTASPYTLNYTFKDAGEYLVEAKVIDTEGAQAIDEINVTATVVSDIENQITVDKFEVYPNPATSRVNIEYGIEENGYVQLTLLDVLGNEIKTVLNEDQAIGNYNVQINVDALPSGIYYLQLSTLNGVKTKKIIIE